MICLLVITDGRRACLARTIAAASEQLRGPITRFVLFDDSGDDEHRAWLRTAFPQFTVINAGARQGFGGAVRAAWAHVAQLDTPYVFHLEDDFVLRRPVELVAMAAVLRSRPNLVQLALRRQPWNEAERRAGGIVEQHPDAYDDCLGAGPTLWDCAWLEHRLFFTTNPSLYRRELCARAWPDCGESEGRFTHELLQDPDVRFGFWGSRDSGEWVEHTGADRVGTGY